MSNTFHSDAKIHELALAHKEAQEGNREQINYYYITAFSAFIADMPFISSPSDNSTNSLYIINTLLIIISLVGVISSYVWLLNLRRILIYIQSLDDLIKELEIKHNQQFITRVLDDLVKRKAPDRVTKYQMFVPCIFIVAFGAIILYCLLRITS